MSPAKPRTTAGILRPATAEDAPALTALAFRAKQHWGYDDTLMELWRNGLAIPETDLASGSCWIVELHGEPAAVTLVIKDGGTAEIEHLWVHPEHMGQGLGRRLVEKALAQARAWGCARLRVESDPNAAAFYERMGARQSGVVDSLPAPRTLPVFLFDLLP